MKKLLNGLVHLYPREWRSRYEAEFRALLDDAQPRWRDVFDIAKEGFAMQLRNGLLLTPLAFGAAAALIAVALLRIPNRPYESHAVLSVQTPELRTGGPAAFGLLTQRVLSAESLGQVMETFHLYEKDRAKGETGKALEKMRKSVTVSSLLEPALGYASISYRNQDPVIAQQVTQDLVARFISENMRQAGKARVRATKITLELRNGPETLELIAPASPARRPTGPPSQSVVIGAALAEGSQLGLIVALFRRRRGAGFNLQRA